MWLSGKTVEDLINTIKAACVDAVNKALGNDDNVKKQAELVAKINVLKDELQQTKDELGDVKSKKKIDLLEIEHLVKMKEEKNALEFQKKEVALQQQFNQKEMSLMKESHEKTLALLEKTKTEFKELYTEILKRLPDVNMEIRKGSGK